MSLTSYSHPLLIGVFTKHVTPCNVSFSLCDIIQSLHSYRISILACSSYRILKYKRDTNKKNNAERLLTLSSDFA